VVQPRDDVGQANGVDVEHQRRVRVVTALAGIAGEQDQVADADRVRAQQIRLNSEQVAVAAGILQRRLEARRLLDEHRQRERAHPCAAAQPVADGHQIDAARGEAARIRDRRRRVVPLGRLQLDGDHSPPFLQRAAE